AAAMVDSEWAILHGRNELAEQFLSQNTSRFHYLDNFGASHQFFTATNREYLDQDRNLKTLFSTYTDKNKNEINKFLHSIQIENRNASMDFKRGMEQGYKDSSNDAHNDPKIIGKGIISLPRYVYDSSASDEVGPLDDQQMETNRIALLRLQGRDFEAGRIYEYNHATQQRLMWYQLPVMELAGRIPSKLANKYKLYRAGKLSATQLAAEIKKQAPIVPNGKAFDFTSGTLIPNQTVKLTQAQNLSNGTTLPAGTIARLTGKGVEATLPNGKNVSYAGVTEQRALPAPRKSDVSKNTDNNKVVDNGRKSNFNKTPDDTDKVSNNADKPEKPKRDLNEIKKQYENEISDIEGIANYTGREAESRGGLKGALEEYARTGKEVGVKHPSNHIQKTENLLKKAKKLERKIKNSTLSDNDKQALLNRINQFRQNIEPALNDAIRRRDSK
ncbi:hypothetical protein ACTHUE_18710, partial [Neisseria sp. P0021.S005]